jgi:hypothetical protein
MFCDVGINRWQAFSGKRARLEGGDRTYAVMRALRVGELEDAA